MNNINDGKKGGASGKIIVTLVFMVFQFGISACNEQAQVKHFHVSKTTSINSYFSIFTVSPTFPASATTTPSVTPSPTFTSSPSPTFTATPSFTLSPTSTPSPTALDCWREGGVIESFTLQTKQLRLPLDYLVYTPPCYREESNRHYPILFLMHGQSYTEEQWVRIGAVEVVDELVAKGDISPIIMVMPHDRYGGQPIESNFSEVIVEELLPKIDKEFRTISDREHRAIGGMSRGAGWAVHFAISHWDLFGALGAHSAAVFHSDAQRMRTWLDAIPADSYPRIYMDIGDKDRPEIMRSAVWFEELLNEKDIPHEWYLFSGYHSEEYWQAHIEQYILWYTENW